MESKDIDRLHQLYPVLHDLDEETLRYTLSRARVQRIPAGQVLFTEHDACSAFPFMLSGAIRVFKLSESGRELPLYRVTPGDACVVSSGCLLQHEPYNARGTVLSDCEIVMLPGSDFDDLMSIPAFRSYIFSLFGQRLQNLMTLVEEVAFRKLDQRLAALLLKNDSPMRCTHQQLADELGSVREMISRLLRGFAEAGLITQGREHIAIQNAEGLRRIVDG